jgi:hypothetical protein
MNILLCGVLSLLAAFIIHVFIWKFRLPRHHTNALLWIFALTYLCSIIIFVIFSVLHSYYELIQFSLLFISLALVYISNYSAIEVDSPSLAIVLHIAQAGSKGLPKKEIYDITTDDLLVKPRINDLVNDRMVFLHKDKYKLTHKGAFVAKIFVVSRNLLNAVKGG